MPESNDETNNEPVSFTVKVSKQKDDALGAIQHLLGTRTKTKLVQRYIDEGIQRDLDPEKVAKLFEEREAELERLRQSVKSSVAPAT